MLYWSWSAYNCIGERDTKIITISGWKDIIELGTVMTMRALEQWASCNVVTWGEIRDKKVHILGSRTGVGTLEE